VRFGEEAAELEVLREERGGILGQCVGGVCGWLCGLELGPVGLVGRSRGLGEKSLAAGGGQQGSF